MSLSFGAKEPLSKTVYSFFILWRGMRTGETSDGKGLAEGNWTSKIRSKQKASLSQLAFGNCATILKTLLTPHVFHRESILKYNLKMLQSRVNECPPMGSQWFWEPLLGTLQWWGFSIWNSSIEPCRVLFPSWPDRSSREILDFRLIQQENCSRKMEADQAFLQPNFLLWLNPFWFPLCLSQWATSACLSDHFKNTHLHQLNF